MKNFKKRSEILIPMKNFKKRSEILIPMKNFKKRLEIWILMKKSKKTLRNSDPHKIDKEAQKTFRNSDPREKVQKRSEVLIPTKNFKRRSEISIKNSKNI